MNKNQIDIITMGCSKNLVDSEGLARKFLAKGFHCVSNPQKPTGEIAIINTCGFIDDAKEESINMILEFAELKKKGLLNKLFVMGCLSQRYQKELEQEIPEVDKFYGKFNYNQLLDEIKPPYNNPKDTEPCHQTLPEVVTKHYAYIKIAEGCDRHCAYCAIPLMTGKHVSRPKADILNEIKMYVSEGVKEFQIIEQELTYYGKDLYGESKIAELIEDIANIPGVEWIRLHYAYPNQFPLDLLDVMVRHNNICKYLDIAFQHISDHVLERMHRHVSKQETIDLIRTIRQTVPGIYLRTTLMVGFSGETDEDFQELMDFVKWARFERMGAFMYSEEEGTYSALHYKDDVPNEVKQARLDQLMALQQDIAEEIETNQIGKVLKTVIDRKEGKYYIGRTEYSSPEIDPEVLIPTTQQLQIGSFYSIKITSSDEFDLYGEIVNN